MASTTPPPPITYDAAIEKLSEQMKALGDAMEASLGTGDYDSGAAILLMTKSNILSQKSEAFISSMAALHQTIQSALRKASGS
jgi:hypothetical protein